MITLYLVEKGILKKPILYLSDFFERNRHLYFDNLMRVREKSDIGQWFKFFLVGVIETSEHSIKTFDQILKLKNDVDGKLQKLGSRSSNGKTVINQMYQHPLIDVQRVSKLTNLSMPSAYKLIAELEKLNILVELTGAKRGKLYSFPEYIKIFK